MNRRMNLGDAMMLDRGRYRESGAENNRGRKRNFYLSEHFHISLALRLNPKLPGDSRRTQGRDYTNASLVPVIKLSCASLSYRIGQDDPEWSNPPELACISTRTTHGPSMAFEGLSLCSKEK
jgi:hypothetical protein